MIKKDFDNFINLLRNVDDPNLIVRAETNYIDKLFISGDSEIDLYIKYFPEKTITISRISFNNKRIGLGSELIKQCKIICKQYGFNRIVFESVITDEMLAFCKSKGFTQEPGFNLGDFGNYELKI